MRLYIKIGKATSFFVFNRSFHVSSVGFKDKLNDGNTLKTSNPITGEWWDGEGTFRGLHSMNRLRVPFIRDNLTKNLLNVNKSLPLEGFSIIDVGCGGGILSEPLANIGASVLGIDTDENIALANDHALHYPHIKNNLKYESCTIQHKSLETPNYFDACVASEVVEHVDDVEDFVIACIKCVKPGGLVIFTTINQTWLSNIFVITLVEDVFKLLPKGLHQYEKFVKPETLVNIMEKNGCTINKLHGMLYNPITNNWTWSKIKAINYAICATKAAAA